MRRKLYLLKISENSMTAVATLYSTHIKATKQTAKTNTSCATGLVNKPLQYVWSRIYAA